MMTQLPHDHRSVEMLRTEMKMTVPELENRVREAEENRELSLSSRDFDSAEFHLQTILRCSDLARIRSQKSA